jgi:uncharacterized RDD family membrane protein YckC
VNDLMLNTLGGVCGYFIYTRFLNKLPSKHSIDERSRERSKRVGFTRRFIALMIDSFLISIISALLALIIKCDDLYIYIPASFAYYLAFACLLRGRTPGKMAVRIRIERDDGAAPLQAICARYMARNAFVLILQFADSAIAYLSPQYTTFALIFSSLMLAVAVIDLLLSFRRDRRLWYELLTGTRNVSYFRTDSAAKLRDEGVGDSDK